MIELPKDWRMSTVGEVAKCITGNTPPKDRPDYYGDLIPFVKPTQLDDKTVSDAPEKLSDQGAKVARVLDANSVLVSCIGNLGKTALAGRKVAFNQQINAAVFHAGVEPKYGFYFFQSSLARHQLENLSSATTIAIVNKSKFQSVKIPIAPLPEQRRIVARIEELFSRLDAGVAALRHAKAQLQRYRQSVLAAAVTGQLTQAWREQHPDTEPAEELLERVLTEREATWAGRGKYEPPIEVENGLEALPEGWVWTTLAHLANHIADGTHKTPTYVETGVPFLSAKDVKGFKLSFDNCRYIPRGEHEELIKRCCPKPGNVLVTKSGTIGRIAVVKTEDEFSLFESVANVPLIEPLFSDFIAYASHVGIAGAFGAKNKKGVAVRHLHLEDLRRLPIPLPPLAEQHQIVAEVEARTTAIDHLEAELDRQITRSNRLRQSTLAAAFAGSLTNPK